MVAVADAAKRRGRNAVNCLYAIFVVALASSPFASAGERWISRDGLYSLSFTSELTPIVINRIHRWTLHLEAADGEPVEGAEIAVEGGMPEHDHGLPTSPRVTRELGDGDYLLEGVRFHMNGDWEITVSIDAVQGSDTVVIRLDL